MNRITLYIFLLFSFFFTSCIPSKDLIYLQENNKSTSSQPVESVALKPYRLQINDILNIKIKAIDPELVEIFNISGIAPISSVSKCGTTTHSIFSGLKPKERNQKFSHFDKNMINQFSLKPQL